MSLATDKAVAYVEDRFPALAAEAPNVAEYVKEDFRAGFVQGLEAAREAVARTHTLGNNAAGAESAIVALLGEEV